MAFWQVWFLGSSWLKILSPALISLFACHRQAILWLNSSLQLSISITGFLSCWALLLRILKVELGQRQIFIFKCRSYEYMCLGRFQPETLKLYCLHPGALHLHWDVTSHWRIFTCKSGLPVDPHPLLYCKPSFLLKLSLKWAQLEGGCLSAFPTCTSQSTGEMGALALALSTATASENHRRCFQLCCLHSSSNKWAGFLPHSRCRHFFWTTPHMGPPRVTVCFKLFLCRFLQKWSGRFLVWGSFATWRPRSSAAVLLWMPPRMQLPTAWGSQETKPMWVWTLNTFQGLVCTMAVFCLIKMTLILSTEVL